MLNNYSLVILDWDGTVVDSVPNIIGALRAASGDVGLPLKDETAYREIIGMSLEEAFVSLYPERPFADIERLIEAYRRHHHALESQPSGLFDGVAQGLEKIVAAGIQLAVATGKSQSGLARSMAANGYDNGVFAVCRTADHAASKPDPEMLRQILDVMDVPASQAVMVGDSVHDMAMAKNAGMDSIAVTYGAQQQRGALDRYQPVLIADRFMELIDWILNNRLSSAGK